MATWTPEQEKELEEMVEKGLTRQEISDKTGRSLDSLKTKFAALELKPASAKKTKKEKKETVEKEAKELVLKKISGQVAEEATGIYEQITVAGQFLYDNYNTIAKSKGQSLTEYIQRAMVFYVNYEDLIGKLEKRIMDLAQIIREQEETINELGVYLSPIPYRVKIIELMILQEKRGELTFSDNEIRMYLDAIDYAVTKDFVPQPKQPERGQMRGARSG